MSLPDPSLPSSVDAEVALLGAILVNNDAYDVASPLVTANDFSDGLNRRVWEAIERYRAEGRLCNPLTLKSILGDVQVGEITLGKYLARLAADAASIVNAPDYAKLIQETAQRRRLLEAAKALQEQVLDLNHSPEEIASEIIAQIDEVAQSGSRKSIPRVSLAHASGNAIAAAQRARKSGSGMRGVSWGFADFDRMTLGLRPDNFYVMAARTSVGKTTVGMRIAMNVAARPGDGAMFFSLEAGATALAFRALASEASKLGNSEIAYQKIEAGDLSESEWARVREADERFRSWGLEIEQEPGLTLSQITARISKARKVLEKKNRTLRLVVLDHLLLVKPSDRYKGKMVEETTEVSAGMKALAKRFNIAILGLHQVKREVEMRQDKRPQLSDFKWSGAIEQDADVAIGLYREAYYLQRQRERLTDEDCDRLIEKQMLMEAEFLKNRDGPVGMVNLYCNVASNVVTGWEGRS